MTHAKALTKPKAIIETIITATTIEPLTLETTAIKTQSKKHINCYLTTINRTKTTKPTNQQ